MRPTVLVSLLWAMFAGIANAASLIVQLPEDAAIRVYDRDRPDAPRIDCPGVCTYQEPGNSVGVFQLKVDVIADPRTGDPPWDLVAMDGCRGTSALPADNGICFLPSEGNVTLSFQVEYRPVVAVQVGGSIGGPLGNLFISGGPGTSDSPIVGFACNAIRPLVQACAKHQRRGATIRLAAGTSIQATVDAVSEPCGSATCVFPISEDVCIAYLYRNGNPLLYTTVDISGPDCPSGPGIAGSGGGGGGGGPPPDLDAIKDLALQQLRRELAQSLAPCLTAGTSLALFALGPIGATAGQMVFTPSALICTAIVQHLTELQRVYDDPPDPAFRALARLRPTAAPRVSLAPCAALSGADRRVCKKLGKAAQRHVGMLFHVGDVATVLRTTVERASAAFHAGEARPFKRQVKAAGKRSKQLEAAFAARAKGGATVAAILREAGVTGAISEAQFAEASTLVLGQLAAQGLPETTARAVLGPALTPRVIDLLELLGQP